MNCFLLRFEVQTHSDINVAGQNHSDATCKTVRSKLQNSRILAGTQTFTEVDNEGVDADPVRSSAFSAIPK